MSEKIHSQHLARKAILYVRQSSAFQVAHNLESQKLQYAMQTRLRDLGWTEIEVIDEDLGRSAAGTVVFVHGLGGSAFRTWDSGEKSETGFWPECIAKEHPKCALWTLHYTARILEWNPFAHTRTVDLLDRAAWFLECLVQAGIASKPIIFVAHSLGGVLVKQALQFAQYLGSPEWRAVWNQTRAIVFLATPHDGATIADAATRLAEVARGAGPLTRLFLRPSPALRNLQNNNPNLRYLGEWYQSQVPLQGIETIAFAEHRPYLGVTIVDESSSNPHIPNCTPRPLPDADHISIAKPSRKAHLVYQRLGVLLATEESRDPVPAAPVVDQKTLRLRVENRALAARLRGEWWERHLNMDPAKISLFTILPDTELDSIQFDGKGYDELGKVVSKWDSVLARVEWDRERNAIQVRYVWNGEYVASKEAKKGEVKFHGFSEFWFFVPADPGKRVTKGAGHYWNVDQQDPEKTEFRRVEFRRATEPDVVERMNEDKEPERALRIRGVLNEWR